MSCMKADDPKVGILKRLAEQGHSFGYGEVLILTARLGTDVEPLEPETDEERHEWRGHLQGLRSALHCLVMHERKVGPESAAFIVNGHISEAVTELSGGVG